ncbi:MAG: ABC transporter permease [Candidatus Omnitrophica bacterium]|nr:ABC transporter permease [Candidatus Omnitrophota bacterium]
MNDSLPQKSLSPFRLSVQRLLRNGTAMTGLIILAVLYFLALFAHFFALSDPISLGNLEASYHPPNWMHVFDEKGEFNWPPFVYGTELVDLDTLEYENIPEEKYKVHFFAEGYEYKLWFLFPTNRHFIQVEEVGGLHPLGCDKYGRDVWSRLLVGGQVSLSVGLIGIFITLTLGTFFGGIAGYFGGWADTLLMRWVELILSIPGLYLILAMRSTFGKDTNLSSAQIYLLIVAILGFIYWAGLSRVIRGMVLSLKEREHVLAARVIGASHLRVLIRHILPGTFTYLIVAATIMVPGYILGEVALSFLGVGIEEPNASWGLMLREAQDVDVLEHQKWILASGVAIFITVFAFNFLGDGLRDAFDPRKE